jgi:hypothetical protein
MKAQAALEKYENDTKEKWEKRVEKGRCSRLSSRNVAIDDDRGF